MQADPNLFGGLLKYFNKPVNEFEQLTPLIFQNLNAIVLWTRNFPFYILIENVPLPVQIIGFSKNPSSQIVNHNREELNISVAAYLYCKYNIELSFSKKIPSVILKPTSTSLNLENCYWPQDLVFSNFMTYTTLPPIQYIKFLKPSKILLVYARNLLTLTQARKLLLRNQARNQ